MSLERLHYHLQQVDLSRTQARDVVFLQLLAHSNPVSRSILINELAGKIGDATIQRTLKAFLHAGVVEQTSSGLQLTDRFIQHGHHLQCRRRGRLITQKLHFTLEDHRVELEGLCRFCVSEPGTKPRAAIGTRLRRYPGL